MTSTANQDIEARITRVFGVYPNFFRLHGESPELLEQLLGFAKFAYVDAPMPSLFKEKLAVYLGRFCPAPYPVARHLGFLLGSGHVAGDPTCTPLSVQEAVQLLHRRAPDSSALLHHLSRLRDLSPAKGEWPDDDEANEHLAICAIGIFLKIGNRSTAIVELRDFLGDRLFDRLMLFLSFVSFTHDWSEGRVDLAQDRDVIELLAKNHVLSTWLAGYHETVGEEMAGRALAERMRLTGVRERLSAELERLSPKDQGGIDPRQVLSERELATFALIGSGLSTREIADRMDLSSKTIETYRARLKAKLGIKSIPELAMRATAWVLHNPDAVS